MPGRRTLPGSGDGAASARTLVFAPASPPLSPASEIRAQASLEDKTMGEHVLTSGSGSRAAADAAGIAAALAEPRQFIVPDGAPFPLLSLGDVLVYGAIMAQMASATSPAGDSGGGGQRIRSWADKLSAAMRIGKTMDAQWRADFLFHKIEKDAKAAQPPGSGRSRWPPRLGFDPRRRSPLAPKGLPACRDSRRTCAWRFF